MKKIVEQARTFSETVAGIVRRAVDPPLADDARPIDVKRAIVEAVERQVEPAGAGRRMLPGDAVQVQVLVEDVARRQAFATVLGDVREAIRVRLAELQCQVPRRFAVELSYVERAPSAWQPQQRVAVLIRRVADAAGEPDSLPTLTIDVLRGEAQQARFVFTRAVVRVGRSSDPTDDRGRPRVNDVAFLENEGAENRTVTRGHAVIRFDRSAGEYRLFDEGSANGTRVLRNGDALDVPRRDPVGVSLRSGDEVQLGNAAIRIAIGDACG